MIIKIKLGRAVEPMGDIATFTIKTNNKYFISEIKKYKCPIRLINFLDEQMENDYIEELIQDHEIQSAIIDIEINLLNETDKIMNSSDNFTDLDKYIESTDYLDKYGSEIEIEDSDLTEQSDRAYEMNLDNYLYK